MYTDKIQQMTNLAQIKEQNVVKIACIFGATATYYEYNPNMTKAAKAAKKTSRRR